MPAYDSNLFNITPYFDDFDETKKFLRILFRPGYAVQARELTQLQTILQNQIERFGNHIFQDGAKVYGGDSATSRIRYQRINLTSTVDTGSIDIPIDQLIGYEITEVGTTTKAKVVHAMESTGGKDSYKILFVSFLSGSSFTEGASFTSSYPTAGWNGVFASRSSDINDATVTLGSDGLSGSANLVSVNNGIFYVDGYFVKNDLQKFTPHGLTGDSQSVRDFNNPTTKVGFQLIKNSVSDSEDLTLRDPASGSYNYNAPGADRYSLNLVLGQSVNPEADFVELVQYENGKPTKRLLKTEYSEIEKTLARRTYDESGSYTVNPFGIDVREHLNDGTNRGVYSGPSGDDEKLAVGLEAGKAYVFGSEYQTQKTYFLDVDKARETQDTVSKELDVNIGAYLENCLPCLQEFGYNYDDRHGAGVFHPAYGDSIGFGKYLASAINDGLEIKLHGPMPRYDDSAADGGWWPLFLDNKSGTHSAEKQHEDDVLLLGDNTQASICNADLAELIGTAKIKMIVKDGEVVQQQSPSVWGGVRNSTSPVNDGTALGNQTGYSVALPKYRVYLYDIELNSGKSLRDVCMMSYEDTSAITRNDFNKVSDSF